MEQFNIIYRLLAVILAICLLVGCEKETAYLHLSGFTMGTSYRITLKANQDNANHLHAQIEKKLKRINQLMSTYIDDSELSRFNQSTSLDCQPVSAEIFYVIKNSLEVSRLTDGKFDVTMSPLISEWGFDKKQTNDVVPDKWKIKSLLQQVGFEKLSLGNACIKKENAKITVNLSAIAKGYGVDQIAELLRANNIENYLVEIGGETASRGMNPDSHPWRLAIAAPVENQNQIHKVFTPLGLGVATSGGYRNYFETNGVRFSHTIDPTTGKPVAHQLVSVTVLHQQTMLADAFATAFMVMGEEETMIFAKKNKIPVYLLVRSNNGFEAKYTSEFERHLN